VVDQQLLVLLGVTGRHHRQTRLAKRHPRDGERIGRIGFAARPHPMSLSGGKPRGNRHDKMSRGVERDG
jgi:hypothetical protein